MRNKVLTFLLGAAVFFSMSGSASAFLNDWYFDIDGAGGAQPKVQIAQWFDLVSPNLVDTTFTGPDTYTFNNYGVGDFTNYDGFGNWAAGEVTGIYKFTGTGQLDGSVSFDAGGVFDIYVDPANDYGAAGAANEYLSANDGTRIATFEVVNGWGSVDALGIPNGQFTIVYKATDIQAGYFFAPDGVTDLKDVVDASDVYLTWGYTTTNASWVSNVPSTLEQELYDWAATGGYVPPASNQPPNDFFLSSNGQFRLDIVPEPTTFLLFGVGLLGLAGISRKKVQV